MESLNAYWLNLHFMTYCPFWLPVFVDTLSEMWQHSQSAYYYNQLFQVQLERANASRRRDIARTVRVVQARIDQSGASEDVILTSQYLTAEITAALFKLESPEKPRRPLVYPL